MSLDRKIISEIERYHRINKYIMEQEVDAPPPPTAPEGEVPPSEDQAALPAPEAQPEVIDVEQDDEVTKVDNSGKTEEDKTEESSTEELDITDLVKSQEEIQNKQEEYFQNLFSQISNLESKLKEMDSIVGKLNAIENKIEKYREKTPQEKLELRSYDSYPFNQKLSDFFEDKKEEMEKTGKKDYVLTSDQVTDIRDSDIRDSFVPSQENIKF
jgi:hypothetical protein